MCNFSILEEEVWEELEKYDFKYLSFINLRIIFCFLQVMNGQRYWIFYNGMYLLNLMGGEIKQNR